MSKRIGLFIFIIAFAVGLLLFTTSTKADTMDGGHWFSLDTDSSAGGSPGDIQYTPEDGTFGFFDVLPVGSQDVDALSTPFHPFVDLNPLNPFNVFDGTLDMIFSEDGLGDIFEWKITGSPIPPGPRSITSTGIHDFVSASIGTGLDIDALESDEHISPYPEPFPSHMSGEPYYSVEGSGPLDPGDVYVGVFAPLLYVDDLAWASVLGLTPDVDPTENLDALVVFDVTSDKTLFEAGADVFTSDLILFSLASGGVDAVGDNVYWYSAFGGGVGGLYLDPGLAINVDALDVHQSEPIPEPATIALLGIGLVGLAGAAVRRRLRQKAKDRR